MFVAQMDINVAPDKIGLIQRKKPSKHGTGGRKMSAENDKVCCNCRYCIRRWEGEGTCMTYCELDGHYICYADCMDGWCRHWSRERTEE